MTKKNEAALPRGVYRKMRTVKGVQVHATSKEGEPLFRVRVWDNGAKKQVEEVVAGLEAAKDVVAEYRKSSASGLDDSKRNASSLLMSLLVTWWHTS